MEVVLDRIAGVDIRPHRLDLVRVRVRVRVRVTIRIRVMVRG